MFYTVGDTNDFTKFTEKSVPKSFLVKLQVRSKNKRTEEA